MMIGEIAKFDLLLDQRHYYSVLLIDVGGYSLSDYWKDVGEVEMPESRDVTIANGEVQHRRLASYIAYPRGGLLQTVSKGGDGSPPYFYDTFALRKAIAGKSYFMLAFPFAALARDVIDRLLVQRELRKKCEMIRANLPKLIRNAETEEATQLTTHVVGLEITVSDDPSLSTLSLGGDAPLRSLMYKTYIQESIRTGGAIVEECTLACELRKSQGVLRTRIHIDGFGNYKFYVHVKGENLAVIPFVVERLRSLECLSAVSVNPLHRLQQEEE